MKFILKQLSSIKITTICLLWLFVLTFIGTVMQMDMGLYEAQQKYFFSWFFLVGGILPFPGARLAMWILFINLVAVTITRFVKYKNKRYFGILITHFGLLLYFAASFFIFHLQKESSLQLLEQEATNITQSYYDWEISIWQENTYPRDVIAIDLNGYKKGHDISSPTLPFSIHVDDFYKNADAYLAEGTAQPNHFSASNIGFLNPIPEALKTEENVAGVLLQITYADQRIPLILFGGEKKPFVLETTEGNWHLQLRKRHYELPFLIKLDDFRAKFYPGTEKAQSFESDVEVIVNNQPRKVTISMNKPLRYKDYTIFQAAYFIDQMGREYSTLAVVKNKGRYLPYIASFITFLGLAWHVVIMMLDKKRKLNA